MKQSERNKSKMSETKAKRKQCEWNESKASETKRKVSGMKLK
jgi:hypothetical protein